MAGLEPREIEDTGFEILEARPGAPDLAAADDQAIGRLNALERHPVADGVDLADGEFELRGGGQRDRAAAPGVALDAFQHDRPCR